MADVIIESDMKFISDNTFHIEKSGLYTKLGDGIRSVEFIRVKDEKLLFVEAKTTFPNPENPSLENYEKFQSEINDICDKFIHSLNLYSSIKVGVNEENFADSFVSTEKVFLIFILVVKNHKPEWCRKIEPKIIAALPQYLKKIWEPKVYVINHETAIKRNLTIA
jgi:hypothetical protein